MKIKVVVIKKDADNESCAVYEYEGDKITAEIEAIDREDGHL